MGAGEKLQPKDVACRPAQIIPHPFCISSARDSGARAVSVLRIMCKQMRLERRRRWRYGGVFYQLLLLAADTLWRLCGSDGGVMVIYGRRVKEPPG